jgi:hypothetical protein
MSFMNDRVEFVSSAKELPALLNDWQSITTTAVDSFEASCAPAVTKFLVTFEMTVKPLTEEPSISGSHPLTDGLDR